MAVMRRFADQAGLAIEQAARRRAQEETRALQAVTEALAAAATPQRGRVGDRAGGRAGARARAPSPSTCVAEDGGSIELVASEGYERRGRSRDWGRLPLDAPTPLADAIRSGEIVVCASPRGDRRALPVVRREPTSRSSAAPLIAGGPGDRWHLLRLDRGARVQGEPEPRRQPRPPGGPGARPRAAVRARAGLRGPAAQAAGGHRGALAGGDARGREPHLPRARGDGDRRGGGLVVLRGNDGTRSPTTLGGDRLDRARGIGRRDPGWRRGADRSGIRPAGRPRRRTAGSRSRSQAGRSPCGMPSESPLSDADREWLADARQPGRAGARPRRTLRDRARDRGDDAAERAARAAAGDRRHHARRPLPAGHDRGRRRRGLVRRRSSSRTAASASSSATSSARASRPRR